LFRKLIVCVTPASPHLSARIDGVAIDPARLVPPVTEGALVIEGAGGLLVPLSEQVVFADIFARWQIPVILCARTSLGTINHTLLSLEALRRRAIPIHGIAFIGEENQETQRIITKLGAPVRLAVCHGLGAVTADTVRDAFRENFDLACFTEAFA
jgi:dethiobiotin synthetase